MWRSREDLVREVPAIDTSYDVRRGDWLTVLVAVAYIAIARANNSFRNFVFFVFAVTCVVAVARLKMQKAMASLLIFLMLFGVFNSKHARDAINDVTTGPYSGVATVISDPRSVGHATRIVLEIDDDRFVVYAYGPTAWRLNGAKVGEQVVVQGMREKFEPEKQRRWLSQHLKGQFQVQQVFEQRFAASPLLRSAQKIRDLVRTAANSFSYDEQSLFTGLVIGDDTKQSVEMVGAFRKSGLAHLVAVSGQNVAFVLAGLSPFLSRLNRRWRTVMTVLILMWFVVITRVEPSVVRAAFMAGAAFISVALGRPTRTLRLIALTVIAAVVVDPLLTWSVGYFMSVGATLGLCLGAQKIERIIRPLKWMAKSLSATLAAQLGVMPVVVFVFGLPSALGILANVLAVPIAGLVMLIGLPMALFAGVLVKFGLPDVAAIIMLPVRLGVRWVWWVAEIFARLSVSGVLNIALWIVVLVALLALRHRSARV